MRRASRASDDRVSPELATYVRLRDGPCVILLLANIGRIPSQGPCRGRSTAAHVRDSAGGRTGKRPPSTPRRVASVCEGHHTDDPVVDRAAIRPEVDRYLEDLEGPDVDDSRPWEAIRRVRARGVSSDASDDGGSR